MNTESLELINSLASQLGIVSSKMIGYYADWYFTQAIMLVLLGFTGIVFSYRCKDPEWCDVDFRIARIIIGIISFFFISFNLPDIFAPEAIAIHAIIGDIT